MAGKSWIAEYRRAGNRQENDDCFPDWTTTKIIQIRIKEALFYAWFSMVVKNLFPVLKKWMCFFRRLDARLITRNSYSLPACRYRHWLCLLILVAVMCIKPHTSPCNAILRKCFCYWQHWRMFSEFTYTCSVWCCPHL